MDSPQVMDSGSVMADPTGRRRRSRRTCGAAVVHFHQTVASGVVVSRQQHRVKSRRQSCRYGRLKLLLGARPAAVINAAWLGLSCQSLLEIWSVPSLLRNSSVGLASTLVTPAARQARAHAAHHDAVIATCCSPA